MSLHHSIPSIPSTPVDTHVPLHSCKSKMQVLYIKKLLGQDSDKKWQKWTLLWRKCEQKNSSSQNLLDHFLYMDPGIEIKVYVGARPGIPIYMVVSMVFGYPRKNASLEELLVWFFDLEVQYNFLGSLHPSLPSIPSTPVNNHVPLHSCKSKMKVLYIKKLLGQDSDKKWQKWTLLWRKCEQKNSSSQNLLGHFLYMDRRIEIKVYVGARPGIPIYMVVSMVFGYPRKNASLEELLVWFFDLEVQYNFLGSLHPSLPSIPSTPVNNHVQLHSCKSKMKVLYFKKLLGQDSEKKWQKWTLLWRKCEQKKSPFQNPEK